MNKCVHSYVPAQNYQLLCPTGVLPTHTDCWGAWEPPGDPWGVDTSSCIISVTFSGFQCSRCSEGGYYATMSAQATCCPKERLYYRQVIRADGSDAKDPVGRPTSGRKSGKLSPGGGRPGARRTIFRAWTHDYKNIHEREPHPRRMRRLASPRMMALRPCTGVRIRRS